MSEISVLAVGVEDLSDALMPLGLLVFALGGIVFMSKFVTILKQQYNVDAADDGPLHVPFDWDGRLLSLPSAWPCPVWRENFEFSATMSICGFGGVVDEHERWFRMLEPDMMALLSVAMPNQGQVKGVWTFCQRGELFGIRFVRPLP